MGNINPTALYLIFLSAGILFVSIAFERSKRLGAILLAIVVMSLLLTAKKKGIVK